MASASAAAAAAAVVAPASEAAEEDGKEAGEDDAAVVFGCRVLFVVVVVVFFFFASCCGCCGCCCCCLASLSCCSCVLSCSGPQSSSLLFMRATCFLTMGVRCVCDSMADDAVQDRSPDKLPLSATWITTPNDCFGVKKTGGTQHKRSTVPAERKK